MMRRWVGWGEGTERGTTELTARTTEEMAQVKEARNEEERKLPFCAADKHDAIELREINFELTI